MIDPASDRTQGFHLFIEPTGSLSENLRTIIADLAREYGGPVFDPHVTLLGRIPLASENDMVRNAQRLANAFSPFTLTLGKLAEEPAYFKALYILVGDGEAMQKRHTRASEIFSMDQDPTYAAHLSLLYGNYPSDRKEETIQHLMLPAESSFLVDRIHLYRTEGPPAAWEKLQEFELGT